MPTTRDYYNILGVERGASPEAIKKAYRQLALKLHPDRNKAADAEDKFKELSEAYAVLADADKRRVYDQVGHAGFDQRYSDEDIFRGADFSEFGFDLGDLFGRFFGGGAHGQRRTARGPDLRATLDITLEEAGNGAEKTLMIERPEACGACRGSGAEAGTQRKTCKECRGAGEVRRVARTPFGVMQTVGACTVCRGHGSVIEKPCKKCAGEGRVRARRTISVRVPAGVEGGMSLRLGGEGAAGPQGMPPGDLYVVMRVKTHAVFQRDGADLHLELPITFAQATLGTQLEIPTLNRERVKVSIPAGTSFGDRFTLRGKGMPNLGGSGHGDLVAHVRLSTPKKLSSRERELYEELAKIEGTETKKSLFDRILGN